MNPLVTPAWLAGRLDDPKTKVLDATLLRVGVVPPIDTHARYIAQHIPGAIFFDIGKLSDHSTPLPHMLPKAEEFSRSMSELGVSDAMDIVIYEQEGVFSAPRGVVDATDIWRKQCLSSRWRTARVDCSWPVDGVRRDSFGASNL